jgi:hypothetical protein
MEDVCVVHGVGEWGKLEVTFDNVEIDYRYTGSEEGQDTNRYQYDCQKFLRPKRERYMATLWLELG